MKRDERRGKRWVKDNYVNEVERNIGEQGVVKA
jgi:hypothetical protein